MSSTTPARTIIVFTGRYASAAVAEHVEAIAERFPEWTVHVVQESAPRRWRSYLRGKVRKLRREPVSYPLEVLAKLGRLIGNALARPWCRRHRLRSDAEHDWAGLPGHLSELKPRNVLYHNCRFLHGTKTLQLVESLDPWLGISIGAPILRPKLFTIPELGTINIHKSLLPNYRGMPPGFWELHDGASTAGVSIHWINEGLDTGDLILQRPLAVPKYSTPRGLAAQLDVLGTEVLLEALERIDAGTAERETQGTTGSKANREPPWLLAKRVERRFWKRRRSPRSLSRWTKLVVKNLVLAGYALLWAPLRNAMLSRLGKCRVSVLLYHRVDDAMLDDVTVGVEQFARHLEILERNYEVLDLPAFLATRGEPRRRPAVVITFDDGYESDYLAAVLLRRHEIPATFFLSTGMIGTEQPFPHDLEYYGRRVPSLSWRQVAQMARWGFRCGTHTVNHARLSALSTDEALEEVARAKAELKNRLDGQALTNCLAYPYGKPDDITDEIRSALHRIDVEYCLSAYGGSNGPDWEPLNILRCGVDASFSDIAFRAVVEGWRVSPGQGVTEEIRQSCKCLQSKVD